MRKYPEKIVIEKKIYRFEKILKDDFFSVNVLYRHDSGKRYVLKLSDFRFIFGVLLRPFAAFMSSHEYKIYKKVDGLPGVPKLGPRLGFRGYYHEYIEGKTLFELTEGGRELPVDFFSRLRTLLEEIHARRILYLDLDKKGNVIFGDDGFPWLIDYQICIYFPRLPGKPGRWVDKVFRSLIREDIYHLYKHKKRYQPDLMTPEETALSVRSGVNLAYNRYFGNWYRTLKRKIYPEGSNEIIWYKWKKEKDKNRNIP